ncbi:ATP-binding protein [Desulfosporosinus fructosivorans]
MKRTPLKLRTKIALLSFTLVLSSVLLVGIVIMERVSRSMEQEIGMRAMAIARTVAQLEDVQENLDQEDGSKLIQPMAEKIRLATGVDYIVIFDMNRIRFSHPLQDRIGTLFTDGDEGPSLKNQEYLSPSIGVQGPAVRAFVPIKADEGTRQVGVVSVGILTPTIQEIIRALRFELYISLLIGVLLGSLGSLYLARNIKKNMFSMEPEEIAKLVEERVAIFQALEEGIIAVDIRGWVTLLNSEARRITGINTDNIGFSLEEIVGIPGLLTKMLSGDVLENWELVIHNTLVLANILPIRIEGNMAGAVFTFRDKTEVKKMAEELTGVKTFIEALRAQNHESQNKLHTIAGLLQLGKDQQALDYIFEVTEEQQEIIGFINKNIKNASVAGLLLGKYSRAKELHLKLFFDPDCYLGDLPEHIEIGKLVLILGNLLDNSFEALNGRKLAEVHCFVFQGEDLVISVEDTGAGIDDVIIDRLYEWGFTTKETLNHGIGLSLVKNAISSLNGIIEIETGAWGTRFLVRIPLAGK